MARYSRPLTVLSTILLGVAYWLRRRQLQPSDALLAGISAPGRGRVTDRMRLRGSRSGRAALEPAHCWFRPLMPR